MEEYLSIVSSDGSKRSVHFIVHEPGGTGDPYHVKVQISVDEKVVFDGLSLGSSTWQAMMNSIPFTRKILESYIGEYEHLIYCYFDGGILKSGEGEVDLDLIFSIPF